MGENKTQPTGTPTNLFLEGILDKQKREDSHLFMIYSRNTQLVTALCGALRLLVLVSITTSTNPVEKAIGLWRAFHRVRMRLHFILCVNSLLYK